MELKYSVPEINESTLSSYCYTNGELIKGEIKAIVLDFHGLGSNWLKKEATDFDTLLAENNILSMFPFYGPWSWMNLKAVRLVDTLIEVACRKYGLDITSIPIISTGGSMGGHSALNYSKYARYTPKACFANCPVCDFAYHATEREDLPRTVHYALCDYPCGLEAAIRMHSAYHMASEMPKIPYYIVHGSADSAVNKEIHSDRFVTRMRECGREVTYVEVDGMEHCDLDSFPEIKKQYFDAIIRAALN